MRKTLYQKMVPYIFLLPFLLFFLIFMAYPIVFSFLLSFGKYEKAACVLQGLVISAIF